MAEKIYGPNDFCNWKSNFKKEGKLSVETVKNGIIYPQPLDNNLSLYRKQYAIGFVLDETKKWVSVLGDRLQQIGAREVATTVPKISPEKRHKKAIFLGVCHKHWGHFLIEGMSRLWAILETNRYVDYDLCYVLWNESSFPTYMQEIFSLLGIKWKDIKIIDHPVQYDEIIIPQISSKLDLFWTEEYKLTIDKIKKSIVPVHGGKYYLTRTSFVDNILGEKEIEAIFRKNGYHIISPEKLPISEQISIFAGADELVSVSGTSAHNMLFAKNSAQCAILERMHFPNRTQAVINHMVQAQISVIKANDTFLPYHINTGPFLLTITPWLLQYFEEHNLKYSAEDIINSSRYLASYVKLWSCMYKQDTTYKTLFYPNKSLTPQDMSLFASRLAGVLDQKKRNYCLDKRILGIQYFAENCCRIDVFCKIFQQVPFHLMKKQQDEYIHISSSKWMNAFHIYGYTIEQFEQNIDFKIVAEEECLLEISLKGPWKLKNDLNKAEGLVELWVKYKNFSVNGREILPDPINVWHNKPFHYALEVHKGDNLIVHVEWEKTKTMEEKISELISEIGKKLEVTSDGAVENSQKNTKFKLLEKVAQLDMRLQKLEEFLCSKTTKYDK